MALILDGSAGITFPNASTQNTGVANTSAILSLIGPKGLATPYLGTGAVLQVVQGTLLTTQLSVGGGGSLGTTGISASITPQSTTSKILVIPNITNIYSPPGIGIGLAIYRGATNIYVHGYAQSGGYLGTLYSGAGGVISCASFPYLDSPSTTSPTTYTIYWGAFNGTAYINYQGSATVYSTGSYVTLMEIAG
jgi:hypothetical protein